MARPIKNNADYFPHVKDLRNDRRCKALRTKYNLEGYSVFIMLLEMLTASKEFEIHENIVEMELIAGDIDIDLERMLQIMAYMQKIGLIEKQENIISSPILNDLKMILQAIRSYDRNRKNEDIKQFYKKDSLNKKSIFLTENSHQIDVIHTENNKDSDDKIVFRTENPKNETVFRTENTQSKVKESKEKESKVKKRNGEKEKEKNSAPDFFQNLSEQENLNQEKLKTEKSKISNLNPSKKEKNQHMTQEQKSCAKKVSKSPENGQTLESYKNLFQTYVPSYLWEDWDVSHLEQLIKKINQVKIVEINGMTGVLKFEYFLKNLPNYWKTKKMTVPHLNQNFNEIINEINSLKQNSGISGTTKFQLRAGLSEKKVVYQSPKPKLENVNKINTESKTEQLFEKRKLTLNAIIETYQNYCQTGSFGFLPKWTFYDFIIQEKAFKLDSKLHTSLLKAAKTERQAHLKISNSPLNAASNLKILEQYAENKISEKEQKQIDFVFKSLVVIQFFERLKSQNIDIKTVFKN